MAKRQDYPSQQTRDSGGNIIDLHISESEITEIDISKGYKPTSKNAINHGFFICPLESGTIKVKLLGQKDTTKLLPIPTERIEPMIGQWMEEKCFEIISSGTTVGRALIGWSN